MYTRLHIYKCFHSNDLLVFAGGIPEDLATNPTITLARAREPDELEVTSPIASPSPQCNGVNSPLIERDVVMRENSSNKLQGNNTFICINTSSHLTEPGKFGF